MFKMIEARGRAWLKTFIISVLVEYRVPFNNPCDPDYTGDCNC